MYIHIWGQNQTNKSSHLFLPLDKNLISIPSHKHYTKKRIYGKKITYHKSSFAVAAFETRFMESCSIRSQQINEINSLFTCLALIQSPCKCCHFFAFPLFLLRFSIFRLLVSRSNIKGKAIYYSGLHKHPSFKFFSDFISAQQYKFSVLFLQCMNGKV